MFLRKVLLTGIMTASLLPLSLGGKVEASASNTVTNQPNIIIENLLASRENKIENFNSSMKSATTSSPDIDYLYDEALNIIRIMEETTGRTLKDCKKKDLSL